MTCIKNVVSLASFSRFFLVVVLGFWIEPTCTKLAWDEKDVYKERLLMPTTYCCLQTKKVI